MKTGYKRNISQLEVTAITVSVMTGLFLIAVGAYFVSTVSAMI